MTLESIYYIGQTVAVFALIVSLVFVGIQIRQNTAQAKADAADIAHRTFNDWYQGLTPDMAALFMRSMHDFDNFSAQEQYRVYAYMMPMFVNVQEVHSKWLDGSFPEDRWLFWDSFVSNAMSPILSKIWAERRFMFSNRFQQYLDEKIAHEGATPKKGSVWALTQTNTDEAETAAVPEIPIHEEPKI